MRVFLAVLAGLLLSATAFSRIWTDASGTKTIDADFVGLDGDTVRLRKTDGKIISVGLEKLSKADRDFVQQGQAKAKNNGKVKVADRNSPARIAPLPPKIKTANDLEKAAQQSRTAQTALDLYEAFLASATIPAEQRDQAKQRIAFWREQAEKKMVRVGTKWLTPQQRDESRERAKTLIKHAWELIAVGEYDGSRGKLEEASRVNPEGVGPVRNIVSRGQKEDKSV